MLQVVVDVRHHVDQLSLEDLRVDDFVKEVNDLAGTRWLEHELGLIELGDLLLPCLPDHMHVMFQQVLFLGLEGL